MQHSDEAKNFSPGKVFINYIIDGFFGIMGVIASLNGILSLFHIWFGWFDNVSIGVKKGGASVELMDDLPSAIGILVIGVIFLCIVRIRKQTRRQVWYRAHRLMFWIIFLIILAIAGRGGYRGIIAMNGGNAIYAAQSCDTDTIRELNEKGEIVDSDKNEMLMRMAQEGCDESLSYVFEQGWDANASKSDDGSPLVNIAGSFAHATTVMAFVNHGADVNSIDKDISLLMRVLQNSTMTKDEKRSLIKRLVEKGADINYKTPDGVLSVQSLAETYGVNLNNL